MLQGLFEGQVKVVSTGTTPWSNWEGSLVILHTVLSLPCKAGLQQGDSQASLGGYPGKAAVSY